MKKLNDDENRQWAKDNWTPGDRVEEEIWDQVVVEECAKILDEHVRKHTHKYDAGTMDWNFAYLSTVIAIDSSTENLSEEEQYEMAIEHFWEIAWADATQGELDYGKISS